MKIATLGARTLVAAAAMLPVAPLAAQSSFLFSNFSDLTPLTLNGDTAQSGSNLRLTQAGNQTSAAWFTVPQSVTSGFDTEFTFRNAGSGNRGEGFAFVIHGAASGANTLGGDMWGLGYGSGVSGMPIGNSIALEFDSSREGFLSDVDDNEIGFHTQGVLGNSENEGAAISRAVPTTNLGDGQTHTVRIEYIPGVLNVFLDGDPMPVMSTAYMFETGGPLLGGGSIGGMDLPNGDAWVGFTGSTGQSQTQTVDILSWRWNSLQSPDACYPGTIGTDVLLINNDNGGFFRRAAIQSAEPFSIDMVPPPGVASAPFALFATGGIADSTTAIPVPPLGTFCFGNLFPFDIGGAAAPTSLQIPSGLLNLTLTLTLQGVMIADPANPTQLSITNAIVLDLMPGPAPSLASVTPSSAVVGGTITVMGDDFSPNAVVDISGMSVTPTVLNETRLTFPMPAGVPCDVTLQVINPDGQTASTAFNPTPTNLTSSNNQGSATGGQIVVVLGDGFAPGSTMTIGGVSASITAATGLVIVAVVPPGSPGVVPMVITTPGGCSASLTYTYL